MGSEDKSRKLSQVEALAELRQLVSQAKNGDATVLPRLREYLDQVPQLWQGCGDLALQSQGAWVRLIAGNDKFLQESVVRKANALKMKLANEDSTTLENMLVERVISTYLQLYYHEMREAQQEEKSLKWAEFRVKQANAANDRHIKSIGALATLQKLMPAAKPEPQAAKQATAPELAQPCHAAAKGSADDTSLIDVNGKRVNGHRNGHSHNRLAALLNGKAVLPTE